MYIAGNTTKKSWVAQDTVKIAAPNKGSSLLCKKKIFSMCKKKHVLLHNAGLLTR